MPEISSGRKNNECRERLEMNFCEKDLLRTYVLDILRLFYLAAGHRKQGEGGRGGRVCRVGMIASHMAIL